MFQVLVAERAIDNYDAGFQASLNTIKYPEIPCQFEPGARFRQTPVINEKTQQ
jgi:hypothetical protein